MGYCLLKLTNHEEWQDLQLTLLQKLLESFKVYPPPPPPFFSNQTNVLLSKRFGSHAVIKYKENDFINSPLTLS